MLKLPVLAAAIVAAALLMPTASVLMPTPASAADAAAPGTAVYTVEVTDQSTGPNGPDEAEITTGELRIACVATACAVITEPGRQFLGAVDLTSGPTVSGAEAGDANSSPCTEGHGARSITVAASASGFTATLSQEAVDWMACEDGSEAYGHAREVTWVGTLLAADDCVFHAEGCVESARGSLLASGSPAAPSVLSTLATPATAGTSPQQLALAALLTVILVLLVAFPTALLNSAVETGAGRLDAWRRARAARRAPASPTTAAASRVSRPWWWAGCGIVLAALISAFIDPGFGFNLGSVRVLLSILVSFVIDVGLGWVLVIWLMRRANPGVTHSFVFRPVTLLVVVAAVVFCRLTGFEPGIVFGLVAGVTFGAIVGKAAEARAVLVTLGYAFGVAVFAWLLYGVLGGGAAGDSVVNTFISETLASLAISGMAALPIALFPVRGMAGHTLWRWSRRAWAVAYAIGLFAFFVVLMPMPFAWDGVGWDLWGWIGMYLVYALGALAAWLLLTRPWARHSDPAQPQDAAESELASRLDG